MLLLIYEHQFSTREQWRLCCKSILSFSCTKKGESEKRQIRVAEKIIYGGREKIEVSKENKLRCVQGKSSDIIEYFLTLILSLDGSQLLYNKRRRVVFLRGLELAVFLMAPALRVVLAPTKKPAPAPALARCFLFFSTMKLKCCLFEWRRVKVLFCSKRFCFESHYNSRWTRILMPLIFNS